jgi:hypothetical protein
MKKVDIYCIIKFIFFNLNLFSLTVNVELALKTFRENVGKVTQLLCAAVPIIAKVDWSVTIQELKVKRLTNFNKKNCVLTFPFTGND